MINSVTFSTKTHLFKKSDLNSRNQLSAAAVSAKDTTMLTKNQKTTNMKYNWR